MIAPWLEELFRFGLWLLAGLLLGYLFDHAVWGGLAAAMLYGGQHVHRLVYFVRWVEKGKQDNPPEWSGLWGDAVQNVYRFFQKNQKRKNKLSRLFQRFNQTSAAMPDPTVIVGQYHKIEWFNEAAQRLLGLHHPEDMGHRITNLIRHPSFIRLINAHEYSESIVIPSPVNEDIQLSFRVVPYGENQLLLTVQDVTRVYRLEQMRQDFVGNVSHELRTPLTVISGYLETMLDSDDDVLNDYRLSLVQMNDQANRMRMIVNDLLTLSRLETGEEKPFAPVSIPGLIYTAAEDARVLSGEQQHQIQVECDDGLWIQGNPGELHSVVSNLVTNAVRYTPAKSAIIIRWFHNDQGARLEVEDNGPGIPAHHIPRLTERFYRVDAGRSREAGGTGLGLAIVKHVVSRHNGVISINSKVGRGSVFSVQFRHASILQHDSQGKFGLS